MGNLFSCSYCSAASWKKKVNYIWNRREYYRKAYFQQLKNCFLKRNVLLLPTLYKDHQNDFKKLPVNLFTKFKRLTKSKGKPISTIFICLFHSCFLAININIMSFWALYFFLPTHFHMILFVFV